MEEKEQKTRENTTEENPVSAEPKLEVVEPAPVVEKKVENAGLPRSVKLAETEEVEPEIVEEVVFTTGETTENENAGLPHSSAIAPELAKTTIEEIPQTETSPITPDQEVEQSQTTPTQETPKKPQIQTVEKIIYQTPPNLIQNLSTKARAKIQERKRKKLDKIMGLFELNSEI